MANYDKMWSSANPGLLVILLDQSGSMAEEYSYGESKAVFATKTVNELIQNIINKNFDGRKPKNRCFIAIIGYGSDARLLKYGSLSDFCDSPVRIETKLQKRTFEGTVIEKSIHIPIWIDPKAEGETNMVAAFKETKKLVEGFISKRPNCPAPVVINISGGELYIAGYKMDYDKTKDVVRSITQLPCEDGTPLIFNAYINSYRYTDVIFPASKNEFPADDISTFFYEISSIFPTEKLMAPFPHGGFIYHLFGYDDGFIKENSRGYLINGNPANMRKFLSLVDFIAYNDD
jgi:hypothetical protein